MPDKLPRNVKLLAVELDAKGWSQAEIASHLGISVDTITKSKRNMRECGDVERPEKKRGPKRKMDPGMQEVPEFFLLSNHGRPLLHIFYVNRRRT
jgi:transposase